MRASGNQNKRCGTHSHDTSTQHGASILHKQDPVKRDTLYTDEHLRKVMIFSSRKTAGHAQIWADIRIQTRFFNTVHTDSFSAFHRLLHRLGIAGDLRLRIPPTPLAAPL